MAKLPTVKLRHKRTGRRIIVNQTDYAADVAKYHNYEIASMRRGDATDEEVLDDLAEAEINRWREKDPKRQKWSGDAERAHEAHSIAHHDVVTWEGIKDMKWFKLRNRVKELTGTMPGNKVEAEALMAAR